MRSRNNRPSRSKTAQQHVGQNPRVYIATADHQPHALAGESGRGGTAARPDRQPLRPRPQPWPPRQAWRSHPRPRDSGATSTVCTSAAITWPVSVADIAHGDALGDRRPARMCGRGPHALSERRIGCHLHADDLGRRAERGHGHGAAGDQPATADRDQQRIQRWRIGEHFQSERALAGHDGGVVIRVDEDQAPRWRRGGGHGRQLPRHWCRAG